jgi:hypothetical protein
MMLYNPTLAANLSLGYGFSRRFYLHRSGSGTWNRPRRHLLKRSSSLSGSEDRALTSGWAVWGRAFSRSATPTTLGHQSDYVEAASQNTGVPCRTPLVQGVEPL